jgi:hypothetical protein
MINDHCLVSIFGEGSTIFGERRHLTRDWKARPTQMPHFEMGTIHFEMGRQGKKNQIGESPLPNRVCDKMEIYTLTATSAYMRHFF